MIFLFAPEIQRESALKWAPENGFKRARNNLVSGNAVLARLM
jgi:hypothetical protein